MKGNSVGMKLYLYTDDRLDVGVEPMKHTNIEAQKLHEYIMKRRKEILKKYTKKKVRCEEKTFDA